MSKTILVGCDPEVFVKQDGVFVSAHGLISGDKNNPFKVKNGAVQVDGMALEFNIDPAKNAKQFVGNVESVLRTLQAMVPDYELVASPVADFTPEYMKQQPLEAVELGCTPDYNAWTQERNPKPDGDRPMRTAAGHIHIGWTKNKDEQSSAHFDKAAKVARQMDFFLGLPSLFYDKETRRRQLYGKAGAFRSKSYGVEYRTLSNVWLTSKELMEWVYNNTVEGVTQLHNGLDLSEIYGDIREIIDNSDLTEAAKILANQNIAIPKV
jgi:hypothetical protein